MDNMKHEHGLITPTSSQNLSTVRVVLQCPQSAEEIDSGLQESLLQL